MNLGDLIAALEAADPSHIAEYGFGRPRSYRGYYEELAFEPTRNVTVGMMLEYAKSALGQTFEGYKGGSYTMSEYTPCWIASYGDSYNADSIGPTLISYLTGKEYVIN
jgi:hypothetical protein